MITGRVYVSSGPKLYSSGLLNLKSYNFYYYRGEKCDLK